MRKNLPPFFKDIEELIEDLESERICNYIPKAESLAEGCKGIIDGIMEQGLTNAMFYMFSYTMRMQMRFEEAAEL